MKLCLRFHCTALLAMGALLAAGNAAAVPRDPFAVQALEPDTPETKEARRLQMAHDMDVWLRRLVGRFRIEGVSYVDAQGMGGAQQGGGGSSQGSSQGSSSSSGASGSDSSSSSQGSSSGTEASAKTVKGMEDCIGLGTGAGVQCVVNVVWDEDWGADGQPAEAGVSSLAPAMIEYGFDPVASRISYLQVDNQSFAQGGAGTLKGDTLTSRTRCVNSAAMPPCAQVLRIYAPEGASYVQMWIDTEKNYERTSTLMLYLRRTSPDDKGDAASNVKLPQLPADQDKSKQNQDKTKQDPTQPPNPQRQRQSAPRFPSPSFPGGGRSRR